MHRRVLLITLVLAAAGCATPPPSDVVASNVPFNRIIDATFLQPALNTGTVTIQRDRSINGEACLSRLFVNASPIADIYVWERIVLYLPAGDYIFGASGGNTCTGGFSEVRRSVKAGTELRFRIYMGNKTDFTISEIGF